MRISSEINQFQDEVREGYMPEQKPAPDYREPWKFNEALSGAVNRDSAIVLWDETCQRLRGNG